MQLELEMQRLLAVAAEQLRVTVEEATDRILREYFQMWCPWTGQVEDECTPIDTVNKEHQHYHLECALVRGEVIRTSNGYAKA